MSYIRPEEVLSPKNKVSEILEIVYDEGEGGFVVAKIIWENEEKIAMRWNGDSKNPLGHPQVRRYPTWFLVSDELQNAIWETAAKEAEKLPNSQLAQYRAMANDKEREEEAREWCEGLVGEGSNV